MSFGGKIEKGEEKKGKNGKGKGGKTKYEEEIEVEKGKINAQGAKIKAKRVHEEYVLS
jgi:hypothetical protein